MKLKTKYTEKPQYRRWEAGWNGGRTVRRRDREGESVGYVWEKDGYCLFYTYIPKVKKKLLQSL